MSGDVRSALPARMRPAQSVHTRDFDGELVILDLACGEYFALDAVGAMLWQELERGAKLEDVARKVVAEYDVAYETALADLRALTAELLERGLMVPEGGPP